MEIERCRRCGRRLWSQKSRDIGYGRFCYRKVRAAVDALRPSPTQIDRALELIEDGGIVDVGGRFNNLVFRIVGTDGEIRYRCTPNLCTCPAGQADRLCYHRVAVAVATA